MPLSQVTIAISHLPTSCSFYLSCLGVLGYRCLGQRNQDIAFGVNEVEFYLHEQEFRADTVKLVFDSPSFEAVDEFYQAALLGSATSELRPTFSNDETPYYKASIIDVDGNRIGVMYRPEARFTPGATLRGAESRRIADWQDEVASKSYASSHRGYETPGPRVIINNITTTPAVEVHRIKPSANEDTEISTRAIIGTILGASAGAAVAYAMAANTGQKSAPKEPRRATYRSIEAAPQRFSQVTYDKAGSDRSRSQPIQMIDYEVASSRHSKPQSRVNTIVSSHDGRSERSRSLHEYSQTGRTIAQTNNTKIIAGGPDFRSTASKKSHATTVRRMESTNSQSSQTSRSRRSAHDVPLPPSRVSTNLTASNLTSISKKDIPLNDLATVVPDDSISQVSTRRSSNHHGHTAHSHHHHHSRSGHSKHDRKSSDGSHRTIRAL